MPQSQKKEEAETFPLCVSFCFEEKEKENEILERVKYQENQVASTQETKWTKSKHCNWA